MSTQPIYVIDDTYHAILITQGLQQEYHQREEVLNDTYSPLRMRKSAVMQMVDIVELNNAIVKQFELPDGNLLNMGGEDV